MDDLINEIVESLPEWSRETIEYKADIVREIVERLMAGGISECTIRNVLASREVNDQPMACPPRE